MHPTPPTPREVVARAKAEVLKRVPAAAEELVGAAIDRLIGEGEGEGGEGLVARLASLKKEIEARVPAKLQELVEPLLKETGAALQKQAVESIGKALPTDGKDVGKAMQALDARAKVVDGMSKKKRGEKEEAFKRRLEDAKALRQRLEKRLDTLRTRAIASRLGGTSLFVARGACDMLHKVITMPKAGLKFTENDILYLQERLDAAGEAFRADTWQDSVESWLALANLLPVIRSERGVGVLECIFSDADVLQALGWGMLFINANGAPPDDLLKMLKQGPGKHIKANAYRYRKALDAELASIRRIYEIKDRTFAALWAVFAAAMVGLFGFLSRMMWEFYGEGIVESYFPADGVMLA